MLRNVIFVAALALLTGVVPVHAATSGVTQAPPPATTPAMTPEEVVKTIANQLAERLQGHRQELKGNKQKLVDIIDSVLLPHFDVDFASILVLGQHAREATPEQRARFAKAFYDSITNRYAEALLDYTRGAVTVLPFKGQLDIRRTIVRTQVKLDSGKTVSVDYAFRKTRQGEWKVYDVIIEGLSYIANYRQQVDVEIRRIGLNALIKRLETQGPGALKQMQSDSNGG